MSMETSFAWFKLLRNILSFGRSASPGSYAAGQAGNETLELIGHQTRVDMKYPMVLSTARKLSYDFMAAEAWWILEGRDDVESIQRHCRHIAKFSDDGIRFHGAYGPRIVGQMDELVWLLLQDPASRQAVIDIWRINPPKGCRDVPCTLSAQWMIRNETLHCNVTMRSSDAWLGWPYDIFNFSMISWEIAEKLRIFGINPRLGTLTLTAGSQHLYRRDIEKIEKWKPMDWHECLDFSTLPPAGGFTANAIKRNLSQCIGENPDFDTPADPFFIEFQKQLIQKNIKNGK